MKRNFFTICGAMFMIIMLVLSIPAAFVGGLSAYIAMGGPQLILAGGKFFFGWEVPPMRFTPIAPVIYVSSCIGALIQWILKGSKDDEKEEK